MRQINELMALEEAKRRLAMPTELERKQNLPYSELTKKMVMMLFTRMGDLFGSKAASRSLIIYFDGENGIHSDTFELWCRKLSDLSPVDFKRGMDGLESKAEQDYREGAEMWPPSYAEFRALAFPQTTRDTLSHKPFEPILAIEDQTARAKRYELGMKNCESILNMFGDEE